MKPVQPKHILILQSEADPHQMETWGALTDICEAHPEIEYKKVMKKKLPFKVEGFWIFKIVHKTMTIFKNPLI